MAVELVLVGAGGFGREALDVIEAINQAGVIELRVLGVVDDNPNELNLTRLADRGYSLLGTVAEAIAADATKNYVLGIGSPQARRAVAQILDAAGWNPVTLVHPAAVIGSRVRLGAGAVVCGGVQVSTNVRLGQHVHLNPNATIGHDAELADFVSVNPGAIISGDVAIGAGCLVGSGAVVLQGLKVHAEVVVGAAACVTKDISEPMIVAGVPARQLPDKGGR